MLIAMLGEAACRGREPAPAPQPTSPSVIQLPVIPAPGITPEPAPQYIQSFTTDDEIITAGQCTNLRWRVTGTTTVTLNNERVTGDWKEVCPKKTTRYTLEAGREQSKLTVAVLPPPSAPTKPPKIAEFDADDAQIMPGQSTVLRWSVTDAQLILLNDEPQTQPEPNRRVKPAETTTYRLVAINRLGQDEKEFTVQVGQPAPPPVIKSFDADDPELIPPKFTTTLRWDVTGADLVLLNDQPMKEPNKKVTLHKTTTYTLKAYARGSDQPVTRNLTVKVGEPRTNNPPQIVSFDVDHPTLKAGQPQTVGAGCTILRWDVRNASWIKLDGQRVTGTNIQVCPHVTRTYTLTAGRGTQKATPKTTTVKVGETRGAGAGDYLQILSARQMKDSKGAQIVEVKVSYGLTPATLQQNKELRLVARALVWNDSAGEEAELPQFLSLPREATVGQHEITLTLKYVGWQELVSDHVRVDMIKSDSPGRPRSEGAASTETSVETAILSAAFEHPDMSWKPVTQIRQVEARRGLLATELKVAVAYFYNGDYGDNVVLGVHVEDAVGVRTTSKIGPDSFSYVPAKVQVGKPGVAVVTVYYNGPVDAKSERLKVFLRPKDNPQQRFEVKEIAFTHNWSPDDLRIIKVKRVPGGALLVGVAYVLNTRSSMPVAFRACDSIRNEDLESAPVAGKPLLSRLKPACASGDPTHLLAAIRWNGDETPTRAAVEAAIPTHLTGSRFGTVYQGRGSAWFLVYNDWWIESFETDLLEVEYVEGVDSEGVKKGWDTRSGVIRATPISLKWQSRLLGKFQLTCGGPDGNAGHLKEMEWQGSTFKETGRTRDFGATLGKDAIGVASLSAVQCQAILTGCNQSKTERLNPKVGKGTPTPVPTPQVCKAEQVLASRPNPANPQATLPPEVIQEGDIVRVSSPTDPLIKTLNVPITIEYVGSPVLTVHVTYGDLVVRGMPVSIANCSSGKKCPTRPVYTDANGDAVFYDLTLSPDQYVTVKVEVPANYPNRELFANYEAKNVRVGEGEEHEADLAPSYIVAELQSVTFLDDEDPYVDEWQVGTQTTAQVTRNDGSTQSATVSFVWPWFVKDLYADAAWYEAQGGDTLYPHAPLFVAREDSLAKSSLQFMVAGIENDAIAKEWMVAYDIFNAAAQIVGTVLEMPYLGAAADGIDKFLDWLSKPESLGKWTGNIAYPWIDSGTSITSGQVRPTYRIMRLQPTPGRHLKVTLKELYIHDDGDGWPSGKGDIAVFIRVCDGNRATGAGDPQGCVTKRLPNRDVDDNHAWPAKNEDERILFQSPAAGAGPYLYIEVGVWDDDGALPWDMLGIVSTLLTEEDNYGVGAPIVLSDSGYDEGSITVTLEVTEVNTP